MIIEFLIILPLIYFGIGIILSIKYLLPKLKEIKYYPITVKIIAFITFSVLWSYYIIGGNKYA